MRKLYAKVVERVNPQEDDVRFYRISEEAVSRVLVIGGSPPQPPPTVYIIQLVQELLAENRCTLSPTPKTPILWLRCVDCSPSQGSTLWYRDFYPPTTTFLPYGLQVRRFGCLSSPLDKAFQGVLLTYQVKQDQLETLREGRVETFCSSALTYQVKQDQLETDQVDEMNLFKKE